MDEKEMNKNGENMKSSSGIKLPIGYRFRPTDEELVVHYLKRKVFGFPLPASIIPDLHHHLLFHSHPLSLPAGDTKEKKRYFFGNITNAATYYKKVAVAAAAASVVGYWKGIGKNRQIFADHNKQQQQQLVGLRKSFIFCDNNKTTQWVMHQYFLVATIATTVPNSPNNDDSVANCKMVIIGDWAVYSIFQRKKRLIRNNNNNNTAVSSYNNNNNEKKKKKNQLPADSSSSTSTSCASEITAVDQFLSPSVLDDQEETSSNGACSVFSKY